MLIPIALSVLLLAGCTTKQTPVETAGDTRLLLDTYCTITVSALNAQSLLEEAFYLCATYEELFSITLEESDVWSINHANGAPVTVAPETVELIKLGLEIGELSGGYFDISIGRLSTLWDFTGQSGIPSEDAISLARSTVDYRQIIIDGNTVRLVDPEAWIDLGGIAKGYIADRIAEFLIGRGATSAVIDLSGDVALAGEKQDGSPWRIGVRNPFGSRSELIGVVETGEASIVTSGTYERQFESDGVIYHHIIDPFTGMPVNTDIVGVTIVADSSTIGDALSTAVLLLGSERAAGFLDQVPGFIGALLVLENGTLMEYGGINFQAIG